MTVGDFNRDGKDDLIVYTPGLSGSATLGGGENHGAGSITGGTPASWTLFLSNGDGTFTPSTISNPLFVPNASDLNISNVDLDGDGFGDIIVASSAFGPFSTTPIGLVTIEYTTAATKIGSQTFQLAGDPNAMYATDLNGDGLPDIVITSNESNIVWTLINTGDGFVEAGDPNAAHSTFTFLDGSSPQSMNGYVAYAVPSDAPLGWLGTSNLKFGDFNQDGKPDLAVSTALGQVSILLGNGDGTFQPGQTFDISGQAQNLAVADFNGDGFPDVAAIIGGNQTAIALNTGFDAEQLGTAVGFRLSAPATSTAGQTNAVTVTAVDANGNPVPNFLGTIHLTSNDPKATLPMFYTFTAADAGAHTFQITLDKSGADVVTASNPRLPSGSATGNVAAGAAVGFSVATPAQTVAGVAFNAVVSARDKFGNVAPTYTGTINFSSDDSRATLPSSFTFTAADAGVYTFPITLIQAQAYSPGGFFKIMPGTLFPPEGPMVTVTDQTKAAITGTGGLTVVAAPLANFVVNAIPVVAASAIAGGAIDVAVTGMDAFGNLQVIPVGNVIHVASTDPNGNAPANIVVQPPSAMFPMSNLGVEWSNGSNDQLILTTAGPQTITVTDLSQPSITASTSITVVGAPAVRLTISVPPNVSIGTPVPVTVTALDQFGNIDTGYNGLLHFSSSDPTAVLPPDSDLVPAESGTHTFMFTFKLLGLQSLSVRDLVSFTIPTTVTKTTVNPGPPSFLTVTPIAAATAGVAQTFSVTVRDAANDVLTGYTGTLLLSSTDQQAGLPASYTFTAADAGTHLFSATFKTSGVQSILLQDSALPTLTATTGPPAVVAGAARHFVLYAPSVATTGKSFTVTPHRR